MSLVKLETFKRYGYVYYIEASVDVGQYDEFILRRRDKDLHARFNDDRSLILIDGEESWTVTGAEDVRFVLADAAFWHGVEDIFVHE